MSIYYDPENYGFKEVAELQQPDMSYSFHMMCVWEKDGTLYWGEDSGCSCPSPFEDIQSEADLERITFHPDSWRAFESAVKNFNSAPQEDKERFLNKVRETRANLILPNL